MIEPDPPVYPTLPKHIYYIEKYYDYWTGNFSLDWTARHSDGSICLCDSYFAGWTDFGWIDETGCQGLSDVAVRSGMANRVDYGNLAVGTLTGLRRTLDLSLATGKP